MQQVKVQQMPEDAHFKKMVEDSLPQDNICQSLSISESCHAASSQMSSQISSQQQLLQSQPEKGSIWIIHKPSSSSSSSSSSSNSIQNKWKLQKLINSDGSFGTIYRGHKINDLNKKNFAIKVIDKNKLNQCTQNVRKRHIEYMKNEIQILNLLNHYRSNDLNNSQHYNNIIDVEDIHEDENNIYIAMEYVKHGTLFDLISVNERLPERSTAYIMHQLLYALYILHEKHHIMHGDIKPDNILLSMTNVQNLQKNNNNNNNNEINNQKKKLWY